VWTAAVLQVIADHPAVVSTDLAPLVGMERPQFKLNVRKLKSSGLTESLEVGYRISPRGRVVLDAISGVEDSPSRARRSSRSLP
jgi:hypothetical protein